jgi:YD repeat-containing protein
VVDSFVQEGVSTNSISSGTAFDYGFGGSSVEFNRHFQTPQFESVKITRTGLPGYSVQNFFMDKIGKRLVMDSAGLSGRVYESHTLKAVNDTLVSQSTRFQSAYSRGQDAPAIRDPWPRGVGVNRVSEQVIRTRADNKSYRNDTISYHVYEDKLGVPLFTMARQGPRVAITQTILEPDSLRVKKIITYDYPSGSKPSESTLNSSRTTALTVDGGAGKYAVGYTEVDHDARFKYIPSKLYGWRDPGGTPSDESLKTGPVPNFQPGVNTFVAFEISKRDTLGQPLEGFAEDGSGNRKYTSTFYEGRSALPVGVVKGARRDNASVLTAENGNVPQLFAMGKLDRERIWDKPGVTYDSLQVHTGRYSFKVTDNFGPSGNLILKDVAAGGFGFIASAWIYGVNDRSPIFSVSRRRADNSELPEVRGAPVGGAYVKGRWQRWEARLTHAELVANGLFADGAGDYLRFFFGNDSTGAGESQVMYVDDIVLRPDNTEFSLSAYNSRGQVIHTTDSHHRVLTTEYGEAGQPIATRDERGRIFSQGGYNKVGEN